MAFTIFTWKKWYKLRDQNSVGKGLNSRITDLSFLPYEDRSYSHGAVDDLTTKYCSLSETIAFQKKNRTEAQCADVFVSLLIIIGIGAVWILLITIFVCPEWIYLNWGKNKQIIQHSLFL